MTALYGLYADPEAAQRAVDALRRAGIADREIAVMSGEPFEEYDFSHRDKATWLFKLAGLGGVLGLAAGAGLTVGTERAWPLDVGGMPIVAVWPNLVVTFELTMLGAILTTVLALFITAKLPARAQPLYDPAISDGQILVGVQNPPAGTVEKMRAALMESGADEIKTTDSRH
jgi:hypothetical protein